MKRRQLLAVSVVATAACSGCAVTRPCPAAKSTPGFAKVTVRFAMPSVPFDDENKYANEVDAELAFHDPSAGWIPDDFWFASSPPPSDGPYHVVLWGGNFAGQNVTYFPARLASGQYTFGLFDHDHDAVFQGWISVNGSGDDVLNLFMDWRDTVHQQEEWLGFENRITGKLESREAEHFKKFTKDLRSIRRLERRIDDAIQDEIAARIKQQQMRNRFLGGTEILLMPGQDNLFRPATRPAFSNEELAQTASSDPMTKVVLLADYTNAVEKLRRVSNLRDDLRRCRSVLSQEQQRLERHKRYLTVTNHLYNHDEKFVENEMRLQEVLRLSQRIDQQVDDHRRHCLALAFIAGLSAPGETTDVFADEERAVKRELAILEEQKQLLDRRFNATPEDSKKRVHMQRQRQELLAQVESAERQIEKIDEALVAFGNLRNSTRVIHSFGPARVMAATMMDNEVPRHIADAIERESLMTVRLQSTDSMYTPPAEVTSTQKDTPARTVSHR